MSINFGTVLACLFIFFFFYLMYVCRMQLCNQSWNMNIKKQQRKVYGMAQIFDMLSWENFHCFMNLRFFLLRSSVRGLFLWVYVTILKSTRY